MVPFNHFAVAASIPGFYDAFDLAALYDFEYIQGGKVARWQGGKVARWQGGKVARWAGGKVGRPGSREDFSDIHEYVSGVHTNAMMAMQNTSPPIPFFGGTLKIAEPYFAINGDIESAAKVCGQLTMEKWKGRLNTVDVFTEGHCWTAVVDLMID
ncbi:hypothetical protein [Sulfitobacter sp. SK012]|uniref:hypothetical protein n=1 Tax=Sulfitobacter sp. SK012 TaxID=1389005 RepID=UPI001C1F2789|nr:hypothetical protein [Sulfitobacter sp. SK012]